MSSGNYYLLTAIIDVVRHDDRVESAIMNLGFSAPTPMDGIAMDEFADNITQLGIDLKKKAIEKVTLKAEHEPKQARVISINLTKL